MVTTNSNSNYIFKPTTTPQSERLLANSLGYPKSWHVVRLTPNLKTVIDTIYAGDPNANVDTYYNHSAAFDAALKWVEGTSTPYDNKGGQKLERFVQFSVGDWVEVYYEADGNWYEAKVLKVTQYQDAVRYSVHYTEDDSTQTNIYEDQIRLLKKSKSKGNKKKTPKKKKLKKNVSSPKKRKVDQASLPSKEIETPDNNINAKRYKPDANALKLASEIGLPKGWTARIRSNSRYTFRNPDGTKQFKSKNAVYSHLGLTMPPQRKTLFSKNEETNREEQEVFAVKKNVQNLGEGDPPWRPSGHKFLGRKVHYVFPESGDDKAYCGIVMGWIADTDLDKDGEPGFLSEKTGKPAKLFHVRFDIAACRFASQDLEEHEVVDYLLNEDKTDVDDNETLSETIKHVLKRGRSKKEKK